MSTIKGQNCQNFSPAKKAACMCENGLDAIMLAVADYKKEKEKYNRDFEEYQKQRNNHEDWKHGRGHWGEKYNEFKRNYEQWGKHWDNCVYYTVAEVDIHHGQCHVDMGRHGDGLKDFPQGHDWKHVPSEWNSDQYYNHTWWESNGKGHNHGNNSKNGCSSSGTRGYCKLTKDAVEKYTNKQYSTLEPSVMAEPNPPSFNDNNFNIQCCSQSFDDIQGGEVNINRISQVCNQTVVDNQESKSESSNPSGELVKTHDRGKPWEGEDDDENFFEKYMVYIIVSVFLVLASSMSLSIVGGLVAFN